MRNIFIAAVTLMLSALTWASQVPRVQPASAEHARHQHAQSPPPDCHQSSVAGMEECAGMLQAAVCMHPCCFERTPEPAATFHFSLGNHVTPSVEKPLAVKTSGGSRTSHDQGPWLLGDSCTAFSMVLRI